MHAVQQHKLDLLDQAAEAMRRYVSSEREVPATATPEAVAGLAVFHDVDLDAPLTPEEAFRRIDEHGSPATMRSTGGRYFGFVNGGVTPVGLAASMLAGAWDQNAALPVMSPAANAIDGAAAALVIDALGLPSTATAAFCSGTTVGNLTAVIAARDHLLGLRGWDVAADGLFGAPPLTVVASEEAHISALKAARLAGLGERAITLVAADACGRFDPDGLPALDGPALVLLQAGNVNTGYSDPFRDIIDRLDPAQTWVHVDGAFGLWANAAPNRQCHVDGVELADSWATDTHKWLNAPYDGGVVIVRNGEALAKAMQMQAAYVESVEDRQPMNLGIQMSQGARGVPVWAILASLGRQGIAELVEANCVAAERFATGLADAGASVLVPPVLNQVLVSFGSDDETDAVVDAVQRDGTCWMGATTWKGRRAMRISVSDASTTDDDVDRSVEAVVRCWRGLGS